MRIISQNGLIDVPYEMTAFHTSCGVNGATIRMNMAGDTGKGTVLAEYSSKEKVEKVMQLLHEAYTGKPLFLIKNEVNPADRAAAGEISWTQALTEMNCNKIVSIQPESSIQTFSNGNIVFRFPKEEELEE